MVFHKVGIYLSVALAVAASSFVAVDAQCADPVASVVATTNCWATGNVSCIVAGYNDTIKKIHNGNVVFEAADRTEATASFFLSLVSWDIQWTHQANVGENMASIRYIDTMTFTDGVAFGLSEPSTEYPYSFSYSQWEHALVTVNDDCKIIIWDQTGDNQEQLHDTVDWWALMCTVLTDETLTSLGYDPSTCPDLTGGNISVTNGSSVDNSASSDNSGCPEISGGTSKSGGTSSMLILVLSSLACVGHFW